MALELKRVNLMLALLLSLIFKGSFKTAYISNKVQYIEVSVPYIVIHVLRLLKQELACAIDKRLWDISNMMLFETVIPQKNY